jgi:HPt (histidine-containing phosphotransfer) domain-containing protein
MKNQIPTRLTHERNERTVASQECKKALATRVEQELDASVEYFNEQGLLDVFLEMLVAFQSEQSRRLEDLKTALATRNSQSLSRAAHALRGAVLSLGLGSLADLLLDIERGAVSPQVDWALIEKSFSELEQIKQEFLISIEAVKCRHWPK